MGIRMDGLHDTITVSKDTEVHGDGRNYLVGKKAKRNWLANRKMGAAADKKSLNKSEMCIICAY